MVLDMWVQLAKWNRRLEFVGDFESGMTGNQLSEKYGEKSATLLRRAKVMGLFRVRKRPDLAKYNAKRAVSGDFVGEGNPRFGDRVVDVSRGGRRKVCGEMLWIFYFTKRLSEEFGYSYDDMNGGGEGTTRRLVCVQNGA